MSLYMHGVKIQTALHLIINRTQQASKMLISS